MDAVLRVYLFKHGSREFLELLTESQIEYEMRQPTPGTIQASGTTIEVLKALAGLSVIPSIAAVIVQWLKNKASRKVIIQTRDNGIVHLEGFSLEKVEEALELAESIQVMQTEPDE